MDRSNLIVNYLPSGFMEADLEELFSPFGSIISVKIVRDKTTGISMGFGFVNFESNVAANKAISSLNGKKLREDKLMKVSVARPAWKANIHSNLYIAGFPPALSENEILELLGVHAANAENVRLLRDSEKNPRGAAVVRMASEEAATGLISSLNGTPIKSGTSVSVLHVRAWRPEFRADRVSDENIANSFAWNSNVNQSTYRTSGYSSISAPAPMISTPSVYPDAQQLLTQMTINHSLGLLPLPTATPETVNTDEEDDDLVTLFVFHLPSTISETQLGYIFGQFGGRIESVQIMRNKGYGFISFYNISDAEVALEHLNGISLDGGRKHIKIELKR